MFEVVKRWSGALSAGLALGAMVATAPASAAWVPLELDGGDVVASDRDRQVFAARNGMAYVALDHATRVADDVARSVLLFGAEPGLVVVDLDDENRALEYDAVGLGDRAALDAVFAVEQWLAGEPADAHLSDAGGFMVDVEAEGQIAVFGVAELLLQDQGVGLLVHVDPTVMF